MSKKVIASVLGLSVLVGGFSATSGFASTEEVVKADKVFVESIESDEVSPQWVPAIVVGAKVVAGAAGAGFGAAAGAWAFDKVTGIFEAQEELDYQELNQVFDK